SGVPRGCPARRPLLGGGGHVRSGRGRHRRVRPVSLEHELRTAFGDAVVAGTPAHYLTDFTQTPGRAEAVVAPSTAGGVADVLAWCYERDVPVVPRGGGTGLAGGGVPDGGVVLSLERLTRIRSFDPLLWRIEVEAGVTTWTLQRTVRE